MTARCVAFYAPMKAPGHSVPSGDREIARLTLRALEMAGFAPFVASELRIFDGVGDRDAQAKLETAAAAEVGRLVAATTVANPHCAGPDVTRDRPGAPARGPGTTTGPPPNARPSLWFTYHCYYKAPDLIGPAVAARLGIPYVISEPSISPRRRYGPWERFARPSEEAIAAADRLFWTTARDRPALEEAGHGGRMTHLPAFVDPGPEVPPRPAGAPLRLLTVAMMRDGDKLESYRRLASALARLGNAPEWVLDVHGDGPMRGEVEALFAGLQGRVTFHGAGDARTIRRACTGADLMVWPGVGEGVGMVYLEAQAAGLPVVAEDHAAQAELVVGDRVPPGDASGFARAIRHTARHRERLSAEARAALMARHSLNAAARTLGSALRDLLR